MGACCPTSRSISFTTRRSSCRACPLFGIELDDATPEDISRNRADQLSLGSYLGKLFNTVRYYYDKDFLLKNNLFRKGIGVIKVADFNWLDFNISDDKQKELFIRRRRSRARLPAAIQMGRV